MLRTTRPRSKLHVPLFKNACTRCIVIFRSLLRVSSVFFYPTTPFPSVSIKLDYWLRCTDLPLHLHVAGWVMSVPHLSFHSLLGGACASLLVGSSITLQGVSLPPLLHYSLLLGCVAATLIALLIITRVCRCHPYCITHYY